MAKKKKQRRAARRQQKASGNVTESVQSKPEEPVAVANSPLASADRFFTLVGFGVLIIMVILIAPYFAHKQDRDFEKTAELTLKQMVSETSVKKPVLSEAALKQLKDLGAYPVSSASQVLIQGGAKQANLRARFKKGAAEGLLSIGFLLKQELSLSSRWHAVSFCRPDIKGAEVAQEYLQALNTQDFKTAYGLSSAAIEDLNTGITLAQFRKNQQTFLKNAEAQRSAFEGAVPMPTVQAEAQTLTALWQTEAGPLMLELIENPLQCAYAIKIALQ